MDQKISCDATIAEHRIEHRGVPFLNANYPQWHFIGYRARIAIADPKRCLLCAVETARRITVPPTSIDFARLNTMLDEGTATPFHEVLSIHRMSLQDTVECGFARGSADSMTLYAALRDRWQRLFHE